MDTYKIGDIEVTDYSPHIIAYSDRKKDGQPCAVSKICLYLMPLKPKSQARGSEIPTDYGFNSAWHKFTVGQQNRYAEALDYIGIPTLNYVIDLDQTVGKYVPEDKAPWAIGNFNIHSESVVIGIFVSYPEQEACIEKARPVIVKLCTDIATRNNIKFDTFVADESGSFISSSMCCPRSTHEASYPGTPLDNILEDLFNEIKQNLER